MTRALVALNMTAHATPEQLMNMTRPERVAYGIARYGRRVPLLERPVVLIPANEAISGDIIRGAGGWYVRVLAIAWIGDEWTLIHTDGEISLGAY